MVELICYILIILIVYKIIVLNSCNKIMKHIKICKIE